MNLVSFHMSETSLEVRKSSATVEPAVWRVLGVPTFDLQPGLKVKTNMKAGAWFLKMESAGGSL